MTVKGRAGAAPILALPPGGAILRAPGGAPRALLLRRFASASFPVSAGTLRGAASLVIPTDRSSRLWQLQVGGVGPITACAL